MNKDSIKFIKNLIETRFDLDYYKDFVARILNVDVIKTFEYNKIGKEYQGYIELYRIIADYVDKEGKEIYVIATKIKDLTTNKSLIDPTRARAKQRNFIAKILSENNKDGALVAFYNEQSPNWRLSFVKLDYLFTYKGLEKKLTPSKRYSFIVGKDEPSHTVIKQFIENQTSNYPISLKNYEEIFRLEKVTDNFFENYKNKYLDIKEHLEKDEDFKNEAIRKSQKLEEFSEEFSKKLMGQISFLYFLQKKGWLGCKVVPKNIKKEEYLKIYNDSDLNDQKLLDSVYTKISSDEYVLNFSTDSDDIDSNELANIFKGSHFEEKWGSGSVNFIRDLFEEHISKKEEILNEEKSKHNFYNDYLEPLFYEALNKFRGNNHYYKKLNMKIPFLNGGLFEPLDNYDWKNTNFKIPDSLLSNKVDEYGGTGILDIFDRYNFTISENEPYETDVAVDPEMLGKVFEKLLDVEDRKSKGAFYTPREIVHFMCKETLINYLMNELENIKKESIEQLIQMGEFTKDYDLHIFEEYYKKGKTINIDDWGMPISVIKKMYKIDDLLKNIKVADPAVGSGAFSLGMLNEIVKVRNILTEYILIHKYKILRDKNKENLFWDYEDKIHKERSLYNLKLETIENSLFGVDIDPSAIEIAKLRLWLSIVVDSENNNVNPLPNLEFNFMVGNSLVEEFEGIQIFDEKLLDKKFKRIKKLKYSKLFYKDLEDKKNDILTNMKAFHKKYFIENDNKTKKHLKDNINSLEWELIELTLKNSGNEEKIEELRKLQKEKRKPYFLWRLEFADVFKEKGGFDIILGNPPYIGHKGGNKKMMRRLKKTNLGKRFNNERMDIFYYFYHLALDKGNNKSIISFITTNYFFTADSAIKLRKDIKERSRIIKIINFGEIKIFKSAEGQHNVILFITKNLLRKQKEIMVPKKKLKHSINQVDKFLSKDKKLVLLTNTDKDLFERENSYIRVDNIGNKKFDNIFKKMINNNLHLKSICNISQGIVTGRDKISQRDIQKFPKFTKCKGEGVFVLNDEEIKKFEDKSLFKPWFKNSDVKRYFVNENNEKWLLYLTRNIDINKYPTIKNHLEKYKEIITSRNYESGELKKAKKVNKWWVLSSSRNEINFEVPKIIAPQRSYINAFGYTESPWYGSGDIYILTNKNKNFILKYILALLNSKLYYFWLFHKGKKKGYQMELYKTPLSEIPIKSLNIDDQKSIIEIVNKIIELKKQDIETSALENEIDELVYDLYNLTEEEKEIVRDFDPIND